ncbi:MAG: PepSY-like domain-containing protein [Bacteroidales bacterium]|nr:PepSY-like domain-containing protein [Bacteroidales bacterium]
MNKTLLSIGFVRVLCVTALLVLPLGFACAQPLKTSEVPKLALDNFKSQFPKAKSASWERVGTTYVVNYREEQSSAKSVYSETGKYQKTVIDIEQEDLPMNVFNNIKKTYPTYDEILYAYLVKEPKELQYYLVGVAVQSQKLVSDMKFTLIGSLISKTEQPQTDSGMAAKAAEKEQYSERVHADKGRPTSDKEASAKAGSRKRGKQPDPYLISEDKVPAAVIKTFKKRMMNASDVKWYHKPGDSIYSVKCVVRDQKTLGKFMDNGKWVSTRTSLEKEKVPSAVYKTIDQFYPSYKFVSAGKELRADKQDFFAVEVIEKANAKSGDITTLFLDKSARIKYIEEPNFGAADPSLKLTADEEKAEKKLEKEFAKDQKLDIFPVKSISPDEIPNAIHKWTTTYYPEYVYKNIRYEEDDDFEKEGNIYIILIQRPGVGQPYATVYFTRTGEFLKLEDEFRSEEEIEAQMAAHRAPAAVPMNVASAFKAKVPDAIDVTWSQDDDDNWVASYKDKKEQKKETAYSIDAFWLYTRTELPASKVPTTVRTYVDKNFAHTEIKNCWSVTDPQTKLYYTVDLYNKKSKLDFSMSFTQSGKPIE